MRLWPRRRRPPLRRDAPTEQDYGAQAEIEERDIDQMIEARSELRRRTGRESVGEELAREALRRPPAESERRRRGLT